MLPISEIQHWTDAIYWVQYNNACIVWFPRHGMRKQNSHNFHIILDSVKRTLTSTSGEINTSTHREKNRVREWSQRKKENAKQREKKIAISASTDCDFLFHWFYIGVYWCSYTKKNCTNCILLLKNMKMPKWPMFHRGRQTQRRETHHSWRRLGNVAEANFTTGKHKKLQKMCYNIPTFIQCCATVLCECRSAFAGKNKKIMEKFCFQNSRWETETKWVRREWTVQHPFRVRSNIFERR